MRIEELWRYPLKSGRGLACSELELEPWGAVGDRRWAVIGAEGKKVTGREAPELLRVAAVPIDGGGIELEYAGRRLAVPTPAAGPLVEVNFSRLPKATDAGDDAAAFVTDVIGHEARLVWQADPTARSVNPGNGGLDGETLSLADAGPLLLASRASLAQLQEWVAETSSPIEPVEISIRRFRPNIVIDGDEPFAEDGWSRVRIGEVDFRFQQICDRCVFTTIDPDTLARGPEPIRTLARHRKWDGKTWFGIRLVPLLGDGGPGTIRVGDPVRP
ncbi:MOSC domain-containing protein [Nocardioides speluncae]|uniref:MOSC domain-containing protein n=1 Tax=Nocardioides speluncae TaxID=2670337 RepID=UPI000D691075|nr:MOSC N-terminal beta barrel domain-containing protein [Nocardioides speluncae]